MQVSKVKLSPFSRRRLEGSLFDSYYTTVLGEGATPFPGLLHFTLDPYLTMLSIKQGNIKYHFLSLWYDSTWDWIQVSRAIDSALFRVSLLQNLIHSQSNIHFEAIQNGGKSNCSRLEETSHGKFLLAKRC